MAVGRIVRKTLMGIAITAVGLVILALIVINTAPFRNFLRGEISKLVLERTGARLQIGHLQTHWLRLAFTFDDVVVHGRENSAAEPPLFTAQLVKIGLLGTPLLHRKIRLSELILDQPVLHLRINPQGQSNWPVSPHPRPSSGVQPLFNLEIRNCSISSGSIYYNDKPIPLDASVHDLALRAGYERQAYTGTLSYDRGLLRVRKFAPVQHAVHLQFTATASGLMADPLVLTTAASRVSLHARLANYAHPDVQGTYAANVSTGELADIFHAPSLPIGIVTTDGSLTYRAGTAERFLAELQVTGQLHSDEVLLRARNRQLTATSVRAAYALADANLTVPLAEAEVLGTRVHGAWTMLHLDAPVSASRLDASIRGLSLTALSDALASADLRRIPLSGIADLAVRAKWATPPRTLVAEATARIVQGPGKIGSQPAIPVSGDIHAGYDSPRDMLSFDHSYLQAKSTRINLIGALSPKRQSNSHLAVVATTSDLGEAASIVATVRDALSPGPHAELPGISGSAQVNATVTGSLNKPRVQGEVHAQNVSVDRSHWRSLSANVIADPSRLSVTDGRLEGDPHGQIAFRGSAGLEHWSPAADQPVTLDASVANLPLVDISDLSRTHYPVSGVLAAHISITGSETNPQGRATLTLVRGSAWNQPISNLVVKATANRNLVYSMLNLQIPAGALSAGAQYDFASRQYELSVAGNGLNLEKLAAIQRAGFVQGTLNLNASGSGSIQNPNLEASLTFPELRVRGQNIQQTTAQITVVNREAVLKLRSQVDQGSVDGNASVHLTGLKYMTAQLDVRSLPIAAIVANVLPSQSSRVTGQTEVHLFAQGPLAQPSRITAHLEIPILNVAYEQAKLSLDCPLQAKYQDGTVAILPTQVEGTGTKLTFSGSIPLRSSAPYAIRADGSIDLSALQAFIPSISSSGQILVHLQSGNQPGQPSVGGQLLVKNAVLSTESLPVGIEGLNAQINIKGTRAEIVKLDGTAGGGNISATGFVSLGHEPSFNLGLTAASVRIRYPQGLRSVWSGQIAAQGTTKHSRVTGRVLVDRISFTQNFDMSSLAGFVSSTSGGGAPPSSWQSNMKLDIAVASAQTMNLVSSKLTIGGSANLTVVGTLARPVVLGRIALTNGEVFALGKRFDLRNGTIEFANPARTEPILDLYVTTTIEQYDVTLRLAGPADRLTTSYTSNPSLPPADIIHLLAFGKTTEEAAAAPLSPTVGAESVLAQGVGSRLSGKLENLTGLSQLTIDPLATNNQGNPGAYIALQQRITGNLLVTFATNVTTTQNQTVELQYNLSKELSITVLRDENGGYGVNLRIHKAF